MSPGAIYLRDQAAKCRAHAASMGDAQTQAALRKLADKYIVQAEQIESDENTAQLTPACPPSAGGLDQMYRCSYSRSAETAIASCASSR
jgi:hypothetical protein